MTILIKHYSAMTYIHFPACVHVLVSPYAKSQELSNQKHHRNESEHPNDVCVIGLFCHDEFFLIYLQSSQNLLVIFVIF